VKLRAFDRWSDRGLAIVGLVLVGVAVTVLAATNSARATWFAVTLGSLGAGAYGGPLLRRHLDRVDREAGLSSDDP
jgi:hypothetical protein